MKIGWRKFPKPGLNRSGCLDLITVQQIHAFTIDTEPKNGLRNSKIEPKW